MWAWLKNLGQYRDGLIIVTVAIYVLGYAIRSIYALKLSLGELPILDAQYVAGIAPALIILMLIFLALPIEKLPLPNFIVNITNKHPIIVRLVVYVLISLDFLLIYFRIQKSYSISLSDDPLTVVLFALMMILYILIVLVYKITKSSAFSIGLFFLIPISFMWLYTYALVIYPIIPQALGGVKPRCAYLNLRKDDISRVTLTALTIKSVFLNEASIETLEKQKVPDYILKKLNHLLNEEYTSNKELYTTMLNVIGKNDWKKYKEIIVESMEMKYFDSDDEIVLSSKMELIYSDDNKVVLLHPLIGRIFEIRKEAIPAMEFCD